MEKKQSFGLRKKDLAVIGALLLLAVSWGFVFSPRGCLFSFDTFHVVYLQ